MYITGELIFEGEFLNGNKNGGGKEYYDESSLKRRKNALPYFY